jgi:hypothetical protein
VSETASCEVIAGAGPVSFTVIAERLLLTPWLDATLTLPEMVEVEVWGLESPARANPGAAQNKAESNKAPQKIH